MRSQSLLWSFNYAMQGIVYALRTQRNMRLHAMAAGVVFALALFFRVEGLELVALVFTIAFVLVTELVNTAVEATIDVATDKFDPMAKIAKDVAAGGVLVAAITALIVGYLVFYEHLVEGTETLLSEVRGASIDLTVIALGLVLLAVMVTKAFNREGTFMSGGWPSGHTAVAFGVATAAAYTTQSAKTAVFVFFLAALVAQSRVEGEFHSVPQSLLGAVLGVLITTAVFQLFW